MDNNNLINEINKLKALIDALQQQLQTQQTEINSVKQIALNAQNNVRSHWHYTNGTTTHNTYLGSG
jgi:DNA repair protein RadC